MLNAGATARVTQSLCVAGTKMQREQAASPERGNRTSSEFNYKVSKKNSNLEIYKIYKTANQRCFNSD